MSYDQGQLVSLKCIYKGLLPLDRTVWKMNSISPYTCNIELVKSEKENYYKLS